MLRRSVLCCLALAMTLRANSLPAEQRACSTSIIREDWVRQGMLRYAVSAQRRDVPRGLLPEVLKRRGLKTPRRQLDKETKKREKPE